MPEVTENFVKFAHDTAVAYKALLATSKVGNDSIKAAAEIVGSTLVNSGHVLEIEKEAAVNGLQDHSTALKALNDIAQKSASVTAAVPTDNNPTYNSMGEGEKTASDETTYVDKSGKPLSSADVNLMRSFNLIS